MFERWLIEDEVEYGDSMVDDIAGSIFTWGPTQPFVDVVKVAF